ncbi:hypothetical protein I4U23_017018 [Adineta vaga]|nr:hypothetical protein I4U23_017018 [Adineta vaga]
MCSLQFNLYYTNEISESNNEIILQQNCLYATTISMNRDEEPYQIIPFCLNEWPSKWKIQKNNCGQNLTFTELRLQNITSQQLYLWSTSIDIIERYQFYLNSWSNLTEIQLGTEHFCNCSWPWFGPLCQYMFDQFESYHSSFSHMTSDFYENKKEMISLTCYTHLQCKHILPSICLDWSDICNDIIDCIDGGQDEMFCWQLEMNDCQENEYRCRNGYCISKDLFRDDILYPDCLDGTDEYYRDNKRHICGKLIPTFLCEELTCPMTQGDERDFMILSSSSCVKERGKLIMKIIIEIKQNIIFDKCWIPFLCITFIQDQIDYQICLDFCINQLCEQLVEENCPNFIRFPDGPLIFGHIFFVYMKESLLYPSNILIPIPDYVCYDDQLCKEMPTTIILSSLNNSKCRSFNELPYKLPDEIIRWDTILVHIQNLFRTCTSIINNSSIYSNISIMYQCINSSKSISIYRLNDGIQDCYYNDDEQFNVTEGNILKPFQNCYNCEKSNKCIDYQFLNDGLIQCPFQDDENPEIIFKTKEHIFFQTICDGFIELKPIIINGRQETDETECEQWPCSNVYTRCNQIWNCPNGADELNCNLSLSLNCQLQEHLCVSSINNQLMCLSIEKVNDGINDCLGATDEPFLCRTNQSDGNDYTFYCKNYTPRDCVSYTALCSNEITCINGEDEQFCQSNDFQTHCNHIDLSKMSDVFLFFCYRLTDHLKNQIVPFLLEQIDYSPKHQTDIQLLSSSQSIFRNLFQKDCHRGLNMRVWLGNEENLTTSTCLCPPNYYGDTCQYQNQRVSLTLRIYTLSDLWSSPVNFIISLIDNDKRIINSYEQFTYLSLRDCQMKFNIYLLYLTRPKNETKNYSIHIDVYEKKSLIYRGSWLIPITFAFLPVHRINAQLLIPNFNDNNDRTCFNSQCIHGQYTKYINNTVSPTFCRCNQGWSGIHCNIPQNCTCTSDSLCIGITGNNQSICVCPLGKFGSRCLLNNIICQFDQNETCLNGGECIPIDERISHYQRFICICLKGFSGHRCEIIDTKIIVSFENDIILSQSMLIHFIEISNEIPTRHVTTFKKFLFGQISNIIYWSHPFHIVIIEPIKNIFYLTIIQKIYTPSITFIRKINSSHHCKNITKLFNKTFVQSHLLQRIKHYHEPCQQSSLQLFCFHDEKHFCLCTDFEQQRLSNCFDFNFHMQYNCLRQSVCENGAQCFQDSPTCPQKSICVCNECFYGTRCQFTTKGFGLSLDAILGYRIQPYMSFQEQPTTVQVSLILTIIMFILGLVNSILSLITFKIKKLRQVGCGLYLFGSSITSLLITIIFILKFSILLLLQMAIITNQSFLNIQCILIDFLIRICLSMDQWLNACVAIERALTVRSGVNFNKHKSKKIAKWMICVLIIITITTAIHDPIHRRLINDDDEEEKRTWCIVRYSKEIEIFNSIVNIIHFLGPFLINLLSALFIIIVGARQRACARPRQSYREHLLEQFRDHRQLLIAPFILIILAFPRLYISFISNCMKSAHNSWLYLIGYFISFVPSMLTFVVFVLPSDLYSKESCETIRNHRQYIRQQLCFKL